MSAKFYLVTSGTVFGLIAILQTTRLINQWPAQIATWTIPLWPSVIAVMAAAALCVWAFRLAAKGDGKDRA